MICRARSKNLEKKATPVFLSISQRVQTYIPSTQYDIHSYTSLPPQLGHLFTNVFVEYLYEPSLKLQLHFAVEDT